ncbi:membrane protein insertion efficiency factor YidD [Thermophilibacter sp.]|uniref:membrane protein insertion efficiency factor YidD n=1 Tax=Thermophilibacter sp. TaxID=2847309 RepID=UPI003A920537
MWNLMVRKNVGGLPSRGARALIRFYQERVSPALPARCIYVPTCSQYAYEAIEKYGLLRGAALAARRICRCHPLHAGGYDPVP